MKQSDQPSKKTQFPVKLWGNDEEITEEMLKAEALKWAGDKERPISSSLTTQCIVRGPFGGLSIRMIFEWSDGEFGTDYMSRVYYESHN